METQQQEPIQEAPAPRKSRLPYFIGTGLIVLLALAAFIAMRYFSQKEEARPVSLMGGDEFTFQGADGAQQSFQLDITPAEELPKTQPEAMGLFVERKDNSIIIGTGEVNVLVSMDEAGGEPSFDSSFSGDEVEVVVSNDTVIYRETTEIDPDKIEETIQQTVELSTIDDITPQSSITVWGRKAGDRIIADVILFSSPFAVRFEGAP
ncbi:MAG: hypothetical protein JNK32_00265 [Anaerolineales bacterium]|nr:hypothetical protein [Anaerolineales bacterium]